MTANHAHTPTDYDMQEQFEAGAMVTGFSHSRNEATIDWQLWLQERDARIRAEEREHVNQQIQNRLYDFEPEDRENGYLLNPATVTIRASDLMDIISGGDSDVRFSFTDLEWDRHISEVDAAAEQRGAARGWDEGWNAGYFDYVEMIGNDDYQPQNNPYRTDQEGDDE